MRTIKTIFPKKSNEEYKAIFKKVFSPELSAITNRPTVDILAFDEFIVAEYGDYTEKGLSMKKFLSQKFGENLVNDFNEIITI